MLFRIISIIRIAFLILTFFLIWNGWGIYAYGKHEALFMYSNLTNFTLWVIFLMGSIIIAPIGRIFCALCPVGEINYLFSKIGLKKTPPLSFAWLQGVSLILVFLLVVNFHISRHPHYTSLLITSVILLAIILGLIFNGNAFCMLLCPANGFLKFYTRFSFLTIKAEDNAKVSEKCMVFLNPKSINREQCHLCLRCFKKSDGLTLTFNKPLVSKLVSPLSKTDFFVFTILSGLTIMAFIRVVREIRELFVYPSFILNQLLRLNEKYIIYFVILFGVFVYPFLFYLITSIWNYLFNRKSFLKTLLKTTSFYILPIFSIHIILAWIKINTRIGFLTYVLKDPKGKEMVALYALQKIDIPYDLVPIWLNKYIITFIPLLFFFILIDILTKYYKKRSDLLINILPLLILVSFFEFSIFLWLFRGLL